MGCGASAPAPVANTAAQPASNTRPPKPPAATPATKVTSAPAPASAAKVSGKPDSPSKASSGSDETAITRAEDDDDENQPDAPQPSVVERPTTSGGRAFVLSFENDDATRKPPPERLRKLEASAHKRAAKKDMTIEELQAKMNAAEERKKNYEKKIKDKQQKEEDKIQQVQRQKTKLDLEGGVKAPAGHAEEEERQAHLKDLRDKLQQASK